MRERSYILKILIVVSLFIFQNAVFAQKLRKNEDKLFKHALVLSDEGNYQEAIQKFKTLLLQHPEHIDAMFNLGLCYLNTSNAADSAVYWFNKGINLLNDEDINGYLGNEFRLSLAKAYQVLLKPELALELYNEILSHSNALDSLTIKEIQKDIEVCKNASLFIQNPVEIEVVNLGSKVNSMYDDHSPLVAIDERELFFTSRREGHNIPLLEDGQYSEKIYSVSLDKKNWESAKILHMFFKQVEHESALSLSPDRKKIVLFRNDKHGKSLYWSEFVRNKWTEPQKFPVPINSDFEETHGSLSADMSTLFFTSDRPGGFGGLDIYMSKKDTLGKWGNPVNLGPIINTPYDEETPQIHYDGKTLYFSSEGHSSMGRLDVFYSERQSDGSWNLPVNLGFPINTPDDDFFFTPTLDKTRAYYASSRFADNYGGSDIYAVHFKNNGHAELAVVEGQINLDKEENREKIRVLVTRTNDSIQVGDYRPNLHTGKYLLFLEIGSQYKIEEKGTRDETVAYINATDELSYSNTKRAIVFTDVAMEAPLRQFKRNLVSIKRPENKASLNNSKYKSIEDGVNPDSLSTTYNASLVRIKNEEGSMISDDTEVIGVFTIQIFALKDSSFDLFELLKQSGFTNIQVYECVDGYTRYTLGEFETYEATENMKKQLLEEGFFKDLWIRPKRDIIALVK